ncbi:hypothetical protein [Aquimarina sp. 2201CG5-10]|uniref:hypothetical protein n=1 Tax=Aquimarina callyspongiae TaxID=3098150 RepID=UPI002AB502AC|nr:hypothetical protein [Aquimarina sp. 2201CG5-10]MDY8136458.1 hypothetical protein [Aquimarina sp. 2201CG5-10]
MNTSKLHQKLSSTLFSTPLNTTSWMQDSLSYIGNKKLGEICITGSHDSGMSVKTGGTIGAFDCNTLTQTYNIEKQLSLGMRYFDIRPVISGGDYYTGHYTKVSVSWQGANGESIDDIINGVNNFTSQYNELIVLNLSHSLNTDVGNTKYRSFNQNEWNSLLTELQKINHLLSDIEITDLTQKTLNSFIGNKKASVLIIVENTSVNLNAFLGKGVFPYSSFNVYNKYSDTNNLNTMRSDQISKMNTERENNTYFLLSWTLTQDDTQAVTCALPILPGSSIKDLANLANASLVSSLKPNISQTIFPNIIYSDNIINSLQTEMAIYINKLLYSKS